MKRSTLILEFRAFSGSPQTKQAMNSGKPQYNDEEFRILFRVHYIWFGYSISKMFESGSEFRDPECRLIILFLVDFYSDPDLYQFLQQTFSKRKIISTFICCVNIQSVAEI